MTDPNATTRMIKRTLLTKGNTEQVRKIAALVKPLLGFKGPILSLPMLRLRQAFQGKP